MKHEDLAIRNGVKMKQPRGRFDPRSGHFKLSNKEWRISPFNHLKSVQYVQSTGKTAFSMVECPPLHLLAALGSARA